MAGKGPTDGASGEVPNTSVAPEEAQSGVLKESPYSYDENAPIEVVSPDQVRATSERFRKSIEKFKTDKRGRAVKDPPLRPGEEPLPEPTPAKAWIGRSGTAQHIAKEYFEDPELAETGVTLAYKLGGAMKTDAKIPVALMEVIHRLEPTAYGPAGTEILSLATHPAVADGGRTMVEKAVNESEANGNEGVVYAQDLDKVARWFYLACGFRPDADAGRLKLTPSSGDLWSKKEDGTWTQDKVLTEKVVDGQTVQVARELGGKKFLQDKKEEVEFSDDEW